MLVLTRSSGQKIRIGPDITIVVVAVRRGQVRLAIEAPARVNIWRAELVDGNPALMDRRPDPAWPARAGKAPLASAKG